jgi:hypothetical protein
MQWPKLFVLKMEGESRSHAIWSDKLHRLAAYMNSKSNQSLFKTSHRASQPILWASKAFTVLSIIWNHPRSAIRPHVDMAVKKPSVQRIPKSDSDAIIRAIVEDGCCIIKDFTPPETVEKVNKETKPFIEADKPWVVSSIIILPIVDTFVWWDHAG